MSSSTSRCAVTALVVLACLAGGSGCTSTEIVPLTTLRGDVVPLAYRVDVLAETAEGLRVPGAAVFLRNDEDTVSQVAWTDDQGEASLTQVYLTGTILTTDRVVGPDEVHIRFPNFQVRVSRPGFLPEEIAFTSEPFLPELQQTAAAVFVRSRAPEPIPLRAAEDVRVPALRHAAVLFAAPPGADVRVGLRQSAYEDRFLRLSAEPEPRLEACARAYLGRDGEEVLVLVRPPLATSRYFVDLRGLAGTCDRVFTTGPFAYPLAEDASPEALGQLVRRLRLVSDAASVPAAWRRVDLLRARLDELVLEAPPAEERYFTRVLDRWVGIERAEERQAVLPELMLAFALDAEGGPPRAADARASVLVRAALAEARQGRRVAVVVGADVARAVDRRLVSEGNRRLAELWSPAWPAK